MSIKLSELSGGIFIFSDGELHTNNAKTAHGLIRWSNRFKVKAVIDAYSAGKDAGEVTDGINRSIPVYADLKEALEREGRPDFCLIGVATVGGVLSDSLFRLVKKTLTSGISVINGLHQHLSDIPELKTIAQESRAEIYDIRKPYPFEDLHFWTEEIFQVKCPIVGVLGTDCSVGKRTAAIFLKQALEKVGTRAELVYTGQTGWMQGIKHGFIFDSTPNDFVSGELVHAIIETYKQENPDIIILEGQSALRNPSGPCGAEYLVSGNAKKIILVHQPGRQYFDNEKKWGKLPTIESEIQLISLYGAQVVTLLLNCKGLTAEDSLRYRESYTKELEGLDIPVIRTLEDGLDGHIKEILKKINED